MLQAADGMYPPPHTPPPPPPPPGQWLSHTKPELHHCLQVRRALGVQALVVIPSPAPHDSVASTSSSSSGCSSTAQYACSTPAAESFTVEQELQLEQCTEDDLTFTLSGATAADCVLCAVDQSCGLMQSLGLSPVMVLVGVARNPALSSGEIGHAGARWLKSATNQCVT